MLTMVAAGAILPMAAHANVSAPAFVNNEAVFWLDASTLSQLPGQEVTTWPDVRGEGYPVASTSRGVNPTVTTMSGAMAGKPAVDFGHVGSNRDMKFNLCFFSSAIQPPFLPLAPTRAKNYSLAYSLP